MRKNFATIWRCGHCGYTTTHGYSMGIAGDKGEFCPCPRCQNDMVLWSEDRGLSDTKPIEAIKLSFYNPFNRKYEFAPTPPEYLEDKINEIIDAVNKLSDEVRSLKNQTNRV